jgi:hypothetical protein
MPAVVSPPKPTLPDSPVTLAMIGAVAVTFVGSSLPGLLMKGSTSGPMIAVKIPDGFVVLV